METAPVLQTQARPQSLHHTRPLHRISRAALIEQNARLVGFALAPLFRQWPNLSDADKDDIESAGRLALCQAAERYDASRGIQFSTYASNQIYGWGRHTLYRQIWNRKAQRQGVTVVSLDAPLEGGSIHGRYALTRAEGLADESAQEAFLQVDDVVSCPTGTVWPWAKGLLNADQYEALYLHHGEGLTLRAIGAKTGVSYQTVANRIKRAMVVLQAALDTTDDGRIIKAAWGSAE